MPPPPSTPAVSAGASGDLPSRTAGPQRGLRLAWAGRLLGPPLAVGAYLAAPGGEDGLSDAGRATVAVVVLMAVLWMTEAMPLAATALIPVALFPLVGALPIEEATAAYANEVIFLFLGGFMIARAMERWGLHRRIALTILGVAGASRPRIIGGFMAATAFLSMWISNTATVVMMFPIALTVTAMVVGRGRERDGRSDAFAVCLLLAVAYAASIGSLATIIGTPPNLLLRAFVEQRYGLTIGFGQWMAIGVPLALVFLPLAWLVLTRLYPPGRGALPGGREALRRERDRLGPMSRGERVVLGVFAATAAAWIVRTPLAGWDAATALAPWLEDVSDAGIAIVAALLLFAIPVEPRRAVFALDWEAARGLPWGILILVGGGLSLAAAIQANGVDTWVGDRLSGLERLPTVALIAAVAAAVILLTEVTSNTATAATLLPVLGGTALVIGIDPLALLVPAALAATCAFMMPVATLPTRSSSHRGGWPLPRWSGPACS
jgi:solute carrier family 13 (sodium-dependent dicarboxylate transporter), member 2/3/5